MSQAQRVDGAASATERQVNDPQVRTVTLRVQLVGKTEFFPPADVPWSTDADGGQALAEFAGRACYQSWRKPNPVTATNAGYLRHILEVGHLSVLEHGTVSFYLTGVSRSLTHELIRHRHFSYSQLSQRYVPERDAAMVEPDVIAEDRETVRAAMRAIAELPPVQQAVIRMRDLQGMGSDEVCEMLEVSPANQRVLLHRARSRVRTALEGHFDG